MSETLAMARRRLALRPCVELPPELVLGDKSGTGEGDLDDPRVSSSSMMMFNNGLFLSDDSLIFRDRKVRACLCSKASREKTTQNVKGDSS